MSRIEPGSLLVATPALTDGNFAKSVVYILEHSRQGTLGLVINRTLPAPLGMLWDNCPASMADVQACAEGGPVEHHKGLLLHNCSAIEESYQVGDGIYIGGERQGLDDHCDKADFKARLFLGHSGWSEDQLLGEIGEGAWQIRPGHSDLLFQHQPAEDLWDHCLRRGAELPQPHHN